MIRRNIKIPDYRVGSILEKAKGSRRVLIINDRLPCSWEKRFTVVDYDTIMRSPSRDTFTPKEMAVLGYDIIGQEEGIKVRKRRRKSNDNRTTRREDRGSKKKQARGEKRKPEMRRRKNK